MGKLDVIGLGQVCIDYLGFIDRLPSVEERVELENLTVLRGGPTATALELLSRFGLNTAIIGKVGDDDEGALAMRDLKKHNIDTAFLVAEQGKRTQISLIPIERGTGRRTVLWSRGTITPVAPDELPTEAIRSAAALHMDDLYIEAAIEAARIAKRAGALVSFDAGDYTPPMKELVGNVDIFIASLDFVKRLCGDIPPRDALVKLKEFKAPVTGITLSEMGSLTLYQGEIIETPAYEVGRVDTTGCGDVFHGAFLYAWLKDWGIERALRFATAAAGMNACALGAGGGMPGSVSEVEVFIEAEESKSP